MPIAMEVLTTVHTITLISLCIGFFLVSASAKNRDLRTCEQLALSKVCSNAGLPYKSTRLPNDFGHLDVRTAEDLLLAEYLPLFNSGCSEYIRPFVCSIFFPECPRRRREPGIKPCSMLCEMARERCQQTLASYGQNWPPQFECERFEPYKPKRSRKKGRDNCFNYMPPPPDFCNLPADIGPCNRLTGKFFFDERAQTCRSFTYGGCAGNDNRFETMEECNSICMRGNTEGLNKLRRPATQATTEHQSDEQDKTLPGRYRPPTTVKPEQVNLYPSIKPSAPPFIIRPPGNHLVKEFGTVTLKCQAAGPPPIEYSWYRMDGPMPEDKITKEETFGAEGVLVIANLTSDDAGEYLCTAENFEGMVDSVAVVNIYADVKILPFQSSVVKVAENDRIEIECNAVGYPKPQVYWRRKSFPDEILTMSNVLVIANARSNDIGTYVCGASNIYSAASREVQVIVSVSMWIKLENSYQLRYGDITAIECVLEGYPAIEVKWSNGNQNLSLPHNRFTNAESFLLDKHIYRVTSHLLFYNVTDVDAGKYTCYGSNSVGQYHRSTEVTVLGDDCPQPEEVENSVLNIEGIHHGSKHAYTCDTGYTMVGKSLIRCINGKYNAEPPQCFADCGLKANLWGTYGNLTHGSTGKLICYEHLGYYLGGNSSVTCKDGNIIGDAKCYKPPSFQERPVDGYVIENQDIILRCIPDTDDSIVTWYRGENEVLLEERSDNTRITKTINGSMLTIKRANFQDAGPYTCKISNLIGTATAHARLSVIGTNQLPYIVTPLDNIVGYVGENVQLRCESKGDPTPNVTWFFGTSPITTGDLDMLVVDSTLLINRLQEKHSGTYMCVATNRYGKDTANCTLTIIDPITDPPPQPERIEYVKDLDMPLRALLMCPYVGKAEEAVSWTFEDADLTSTLRRYTVTNRRLIIHDANDSDNGIYTCNVRTTKGIQIYRTILTITPAESILPKVSISSGEDEVLSDSGFTNPLDRPANSAEFRTTHVATTQNYTESPKVMIHPLPKQANDEPGINEPSRPKPCTESSSKIKPRRRDINDTGIPHYFRGWVDVQGQGAANDYCRLISPRHNQLMLACALAGTEGESQYNYVSTLNLDPGYEETSYMKDEDGDGRDDYCRCVGAGREMNVWCMKATADGFAGKTEGGTRDDGTGPSQYTFLAPGHRGRLRKCRKTRVDPFFGLPV